MNRPEGKSRFAILAAVSLLAFVVIAASFRLDGGIRESVVSAQGKDWKKTAAYDVCAAASRYGDWPELMIFGAAGLFVAWRARSRDWKRILITAMAASTLAGVCANTLRLTTGRTRPRESPKIAQAWYGPFHDGRLTIGNSKYNSFPSGHTATAFGFAGVILLARPLLGSLAMVAALGIALSRILLGAHHPSDIAVAAVLALGVAWICWRVALRRGDAIAAWAAKKIRRKS